MYDSFELKNHTSDPSLKYFMEHPIRNWSYKDFESAVNKSKQKTRSSTKIKNDYLSAMNNIQNLSDVPECVKKEARRLSSLQGPSEKESNNVIFNIVANDSNVINCSTGTSYTGQNSLPNTKEAALKPTPVLTHFGDEYENEKEIEVQDKEEEEENEIPSDLTIDYHPRRTCEYTLTYEKSDEASTSTEVDKDDSKWIVDNTCISDSCFALKNTTSKLAKQANPAQLSDIRILVLNDIYIFDKNSAFSVTKYFSDAIHNSLKPTLFFEKYTPTYGLNCYDWCLEIETCPPVDWSSSLSLCAELLTAACKSGNLLDMHTAQVLTQILPVLINGPPDDTIEDSYVHCYLSPLLSSLFASSSRLKMKWANGQLKDDTLNAFKPDFSVYSLSSSTKCVVLIAEFKPKEQNSYIESDLVKLAKQMKSILNTLIVNGVSKPKVCGIQCEGENVFTYTMDLPSPKLYRMANVSKIKLFKNLDQISLLPSVIAHLLYLKTVVSETASKVETAVLFKYNNLKRPSPIPPLSWLSSGSVTVSRIPKKQKKQIPFPDY